MNGCGAACVLFIWVGFLWPFLVTSVYAVWKDKRIEKTGIFSLVSILAGYAVMIGAEFLVTPILNNFVGLDEEEYFKNNMGSVILWMDVHFIVFFVLLPVVVIHFISTKFQGKR